MRTAGGNSDGNGLGLDIRHNLLSPEYVPTVWTMVDNKLLCLLPYVLSVFILWLGIHVFRKYSSKFAEVL